MKSIPIRTCIGCREAKSKKELIRIVKSSENEITVDITGKKNGRGAYICPKIECLEMAIKGRKLSKEFSIQIDNNIYDELRKQIISLAEENDG